MKNLDTRIYDLDLSLTNSGRFRSNKTVIEPLMLGKVSSKNNILFTNLGKNVDGSGNKIKVKRRSTTALQASKSNMTGQAAHQTDQTDYHRSDRYYNRSDRLNRITQTDLHTLHPSVQPRYPSASRRVNAGSRDRSRHVRCAWCDSYGNTNKH